MDELQYRITDIEFRPSEDRTETTLGYTITIHLDENELESYLSYPLDQSQI
jgi:hypothetical protein